MAWSPRRSRPAGLEDAALHDAELRLPGVADVTSVWRDDRSAQALRHGCAQRTERCIDSAASSASPG